MFRTLFGPSKASAKGASYAQFIYLSHELQAVRAKLNQLMLGDGSVALISGRSGSGKSFLLQLLASDFEGRRSSRRVVSLSCNFGFSGADLVRRVCEKLGAPHAASLAADEDHHLRRSLLDGVGKDRLTILLVDEAQNLDEGELDRFLRLTELHAGSHGKLRIVLTGRSDAEQAFARAARRHPRRVWRHRLQPLQRQEIAPFIAAWLRAKGRKRDNKLFPPEAVEGIARYSAGVPGLVIELCATALHLAAEGVRQPFAAEDIEEVADYLQLDLSEPSSDPAFNEDLADDTDDRPVEEERGTAVALPMPASRRPAPPPPEDDVVVLPFASEPAKPERPRAQLPVRRPRPAGLEKVLPKQAPALTPASPQRARPKQPKRVVQLESVDAPRPSRRFAMPEAEDAFVPGPRPAAMATRGRSRRRAGWAGRAAALAAVAGMALLLLVAWQYMTDRSPLEVATAILGLDAPSPGEADAGAAPAATATRAGATDASPAARRAATSVPVPSPVPDKAEPAPALAANDTAEMGTVAREPPPLPAMRDMAAPKDSAGGNVAAAPKPSPGATEQAPEEGPPPAQVAERARPSEPEEPARVAQGAPPVTEQPKQPAPAAQPTPAPKQPEPEADHAMASVESAGQAEAAKAANGRTAATIASPPERDVAATAPAKEEVAALPPSDDTPTPSPATQEPAADSDAKAASPPVAVPADPIPGLLAQARRQIEDYALTTPKGDNAMETYRQILRIAPGYPQALQGIRDVARTYLRLADAAERSGDVTHMQRYREKAIELAPDDPMVVALRRARAQQQARAATPRTAPQPASQPVAPAPSAAAAPEGDAGQLAAASGIIKLLQERFARKDSTLAPAAPSQPGNAVVGGQDSRQAASPAPAPRNVNRRPTGPMALAAFDQPGGIEQAIAQGRDVNTRFADGRTPLIVAAARGETDRVKLLLANGAEADATTGDAATALMYAAWNGDPDATEALLRHGANPNKRNVDGKTALMAAATNGHVGTAQTLLRHGATVDTRANNGWTALMYAAWTGNAEVAGTLLEHKADPAIANDAGDTAADLAAQRGYTAIVNMLHARRMAGGRKVGSVRTANRGAASRGGAVAH